MRHPGESFIIFCSMILSPRDAGMAFMRTQLYFYFTKPIFGVQAFRMRPSVLGLLWHLRQVTSKCGLLALLMTDLLVGEINIFCLETLFCKGSE